MLKLPHTRNEWIVAVVSALVGFFGGGALIAGVQWLFARVFGMDF